MKRFLFAVAVVLTVGFMSVCAYANPVGEIGEAAGVTVEEQELRELDFTLTGGIKDDGTAESTFDESRTISGKSEDGSVIDIVVYKKNASGELEESSSYNIGIGASGLFSQAVDLQIGENLVVLDAQMDGCITIHKEIVIKRKKREIKTELENIISLPGSYTNLARQIVTVN